MIYCTIMYFDTHMFFILGPGSALVSPPHLLLLHAVCDIVCSYYDRQ